MAARIVICTLESLQRRVMRAVRAMLTEKIPILKARGRVLSETVRAPRNYPESHLSAMDGFAVHHADLAGATENKPAALHIAGTVAAGQTHGSRLRRGTAVRIMTGAPLPAGADCIVRVEETTVHNEQVLISKPLPPFHDVRRKSVDMRRGQIVLCPGITIGPSEMAMLALLDRPRVNVFRRPRVGVLTTGDELSEVGRPRPPGHIPDSNRYALIGLVASAGCVPVDGGRAGDNPRVLERRLRALARRSDFIVTSGGVSAGDYDVVKILFRKIGGVTLYRLPIKPGKPQAFGSVDGIPFFGLPGNPVSAMVVFDVLVRPALGKMAGRSTVTPPAWQAVAAEDFPRKSRQWEFVRAVLETTGASPTVRPVKSQRSSDMRSMTDADGYVVLSPDKQAPKRGQAVTFVPFIR